MKVKITIYELFKMLRELPDGTNYNLYVNRNGKLHKLESSDILTENEKENLIIEVDNLKLN